MLYARYLKLYYNISPSNLLCSEKPTSVHSDHQQHYYHSRAAHVFSGSSAVACRQRSLDTDSPAPGSKQCSDCSDAVNNSGHSHTSYNAACMMATRGQHLNDTFPPRHYNAQAYQDASTSSLHSKTPAADATLARRLDGDFRRASREREGSPISTSSAASTQPEPLDFTLGSKGSSSNGDKDTNLVHMSASNDELDVSLEHETTPGFYHGRQGNSRQDKGSPQYRQTPQSYYASATDLANHNAVKKSVTPSRSRSVEMLDRVHIDSEVRHSVPTRRSENVSRSRSERPAHQGESETRGVSRKRERALPINSARLRPIRQRTRNAVVSVLTSLCFCASVCVCFVFVCVYACLHVCV